MSWVKDLWETLTDADGLRLQRRMDEAKERFNVVRREDGRDVITYNGVVVSLPTDEDVLDRLQYLRDSYINS